MQDQPTRGRPPGASETLRKAFASRLPARVTEVERASARIAAGERDEDALRALFRLVRSLGAGGVELGFAEVAAAAAEIERVVSAVLEAGGPPDHEQVEVIVAQVELLRGELRRPETRYRAPTEPGPYGNAILVPRGSLSSRERPRAVFVAHRDAATAEQLARNIGCFGYDVVVFDGAATLADAIASRPPSAVIVDIELPGADRGALAARSATRREDRAPVPVVYTSTRRDLAARLAAIRAGAAEYLVEPVDVVELVDKIERLTAEPPADPYRLVIVDPDAGRAGRRAAAVARGGMGAEVVTDALVLAEALIEHRPDIVVMNADMPDYSGLELAAAIRQQDAYVGIPILFVAGDKRIGQRLAAARLGGEPFLIEPFDDNYLVATVRGLVKRSRVLRRLMVRDSLTGLLDHTHIKEALRHEIARARREGTRVCYAMIDIDDFKPVNDTLGHGAGDRLLKSLARLLQQSLRKTDSIGRYGGDELAVVLPGTDGEAAVELLDSIRGAFVEVRRDWQVAGAATGFSAGVAAFDAASAAAAEEAPLDRVADEALYAAKRAGKNRVLLGDPI